MYEWSGVEADLARQRAAGLRRRGPAAGAGRAARAPPRRAWRPAAWRPRPATRARPRPRARGTATQERRTREPTTRACGTPAHGELKRSHRPISIQTYRFSMKRILTRVSVKYTSVRVRVRWQYKIIFVLSEYLFKN